LVAYLTTPEAAPQRQPEQEPVAVCEYCEKERPVIHPPRREWQGLSEEEVDAVWEEAQVFNTHYDIARAIEAKLKEKNHE
jgi:hypothetical protein